MKLSSYIKCLNYINSRQVFIVKRNLHVGEKVTVEKVIYENHVQLFRELTNDWNPIHFPNENNKAVVHGMLLNGLVSAVLGTELPGPGTILLEHLSKFPNPCYVSEKVNVTVEITSVRKIIECRFTCTVDQKIVLHGIAKLLFKEKWPR